MVRPTKKLSTNEFLAEKKKYEEVANEEVTDLVTEEETGEVTELPKHPLRSIFYCQEYKDLTVDVKSPQMDVINGKRIFTQGKSVRFQDHQLETDDQEVIDHIRGHVWYGIKIIEQGA